MSAATFMNNPNYVEYVRLLRQLHRLIAEGNDGDEGDALRDDMDAPWYALSEEEIARIRGLSADLYTLDDAPAAPTHQKSAAAKALGAEIQRAWEARDWEGVLDLLRRSPGVWPPHSEAFLRGWSWNQLGDPDTADLFFQRAAELAPHDTKPSVAVVVAQSRAGHVEEADRYAQAILAPAA
ncbi:MAG TPA: hypothetical protein VKA46_25005 [Gemmataceae bacterium]|nr:hypothetical protein [Gemmataceae bacterium]